MDQPSTSIQLIRPSSGWRAVNLREVWRFRHLIESLATRDVKLRYRQTALGVIWVVLQPLLAAGIFSFVFGTVAQLPSDGVPYAVFAYAGLLCWNVFNSIVTRSSTSLVQNGSMLSKVYFPRLVLPLSTIYSALLDFTVALGLMAVLMATSGIEPTYRLLFLPLFLLITVVLALGLGVVSSALMVTYRDVGQILPVAMQMLLYASPVAFSTAAVPADLRWLFSLNPLVGVLDGFRWSLLSSDAPSVLAVVYSAVAALTLFTVSLAFFARMERKFADVI